MMIRKIYTKPHNLDQLHDEILAVFPTLTGEMKLFGSATDLNTFAVLYPDTANIVAIEAIITAHVPTSPTPQSMTQPQFIQFLAAKYNIQLNP